MIGLLIFGVSFISSDILKAADPQGVTVTLLKTQILTSATGTAVTVVDKTADGGVPIDIVNAASKVFGTGTSIPVGTYKWLKLTVKNQISFVVAAADLCQSDPGYGGPTPLTKTFQIMTGPGYTTDTPVDLYFAYGADSYSYNPSGTSTSDPFFMEHPLVVAADKTTDVKIVFKMNNAVRCDVNNQSAMNPLITDIVSYVVQPPTACTFPASYWWIDYNMWGKLTDNNGNPIINPTLDQMLKHVGIIASFGTIKFNNDGTWTVDGTKTVENGGMMEHRHNLTNYGMDGGYYNGNSPASGSTTGTYTLAGSKVIMSAGDWYGEGAFTDDCGTFLVVNSSLSDNNMIYGVKKLTSALTGSVSDTSVGIGPEFGIMFSAATTTATASALSYHNHFRASDAANNFEWKTITEYQLLDSGTGITGFLSYGAEEMTALQASFSGGLTIGSDGLIPLGDSYAALGVNGDSIFAGLIPYSQATNTVIPDESQTYHGLETGYTTPVAQNPTFADLAGTWSIGVLSSDVDKGSDGNWGTGDEQSHFGLSFGEMAIDSAGVVTSVNIFNKDLFTGLVTKSPIFSTNITGPHTECYATAGTPITDPTCTGGIKVPVFYMMNGSTIDAKLALAKNKKTLVFWSPIDFNDTPEGGMGISNCGPVSNTPCTKGQPHALNGMAVKMK